MMKHLILKGLTAFLLLLFTPVLIYSQVYETQNENKITRIIFDNEYIVVSNFKASSGEFLSTLGGYFEKEENQFKIELEFNSNYEIDSLTNYSINIDSNWRKISKNNDVLKGKWVMSGRYVNDEYITRDVNLPRKTMKFLHDGFFQWIAFNSDTFAFSGSGGGEYETIDGKYIEKIQYFSRDDSRVGAELDFNFELKDNNWIHSGLSSRGTPINEVWTIRKKL